MRTFIIAPSVSSGIKEVEDPVTSVILQIKDLGGCHKIRWLKTPVKKGIELCLVINNTIRDRNHTAIQKLMEKEAKTHYSKVM
jgi:hypothetical protein